MTPREALDAIVRVIRDHDGEAIADLQHIAEIVAQADTTQAVVFGADV